MNEKYVKRVIVALDGMTLEEAKALVLKIGPLGVGFKVGLEFICAGEAHELLRFIKENGGWAFLDPKLNDIPNTVAKASTRIASSFLSRIFNVHTLGGEEMMKAAMQAVNDYFINSHSPYVDKPLVIGVTILTSLKSDDLEKIGLIEIGEKKLGSSMAVLAEDQDGVDSANKAAKHLVGIDVQMLVVKLAKLAQSSGLDGVVCSPLEIKAIREACGPDFLIVTPGVRPAGAALGDQKRVMTPGEAIEAGSNYLVIGRPITEAKDPVEATKKIVEEIAEAMEVK